jgi:exodeoxyribonuclease III
VKLRKHPVRIATYNVNGINGRLSSLVEWLKETAPDAVCLQELKAPDERFPEDPMGVWLATCAFGE